MDRTGSAGTPSCPLSVVLYTTGLVMGGVEQNVLDISSTLVQRGHRAAVICYGAPGTKPLREGLRASGVELHPMMGDATPLGRLRRLRQLVSVLRRYPGAVVHFVEGWPARDGLAFVAARLAGAGALLRTEQEPPVCPVSRGQKLLTGLKDRFLYRVVCVSEGNRQEYIEALGRDPARTVVIPNAIQVATFTGARSNGSLMKEFGLPRGAPVVGFVGRLAEERKGAHFFIEMAAQVAKEDPQARFLVVGDGPRRPELEALAGRVGVAARTVFTGERRDVPALLKAMTVFVQPSLAEGASYALMEAMAAGLPVVVFPSGLVPELIRDGENGFVVPMRDTRGLAAAVLRLLRDEGLRHTIAREGEELVVSRYSVDAMVDRFVGLYREALGR